MSDERTTTPPAGIRRSLEVRVGRIEHGLETVQRQNVNQSAELAGIRDDIMEIKTALAVAAESKKHDERSKEFWNKIVIGVLVAVGVGLAGILGKIALMVQGAK